jgi:hypothetical protein
VKNSEVEQLLKLKVLSLFYKADTRLVGHPMWFIKTRVGGSRPCRLAAIFKDIFFPGQVKNGLVIYA